MIFQWSSNIISATFPTHCRSTSWMRSSTANALTTFEAVAKDGQGVFVTLKEIGRQVIERINTNQSEPRRRTGNTVPKGVSRRSTHPLPQAVDPAAATTPLQAPHQQTPLSTSLPQPHGIRGQEETVTASAPHPATKRQPTSQPPASFMQAAAQNAPTQPAMQAYRSETETSADQRATKPINNQVGEVRAAVPRIARLVPSSVI